MTECQLELQRLEGLHASHHDMNIEFRNLTYIVSGGKGIVYVEF